MATYLSLVNRVLTRLNETALTSTTFAATDLLGPQLLAKDAINDSINAIYSRGSKFPWDYEEVTQVMTPGLFLYTLPTTAAFVDYTSFFIEKDDGLGTDGVESRTLEQKDITINRERFLTSMRNAESTDFTIPESVFSSPNRKFGVFKIPDLAYSIKYDTWNYNVELTAATDVPKIFDQYLPIVIDGAMIRMYAFVEDDMLRRELKADFKKGIERIIKEQIPYSPNWTAV